MCILQLSPQDEAQRWIKSAMGRGWTFTLKDSNSYNFNELKATFEEVEWLKMQCYEQSVAVVAALRRAAVTRKFKSKDSDQYSSGQGAVQC